jgi:predicted amidophosphoribosyltransferase
MSLQWGQLMNQASPVEAGRITSQQLAASLRTGPLRPMLDRIVRNAAELTGLPYMVLGLRHNDLYEFIAMHGIPLAVYSDRVPARTFKASLFAREVEVADLQKEPQFAALSITPIARSWRFGANAPVRLHQALSDDGVLALSGAHTRRRSLGSGTLATLRMHAEIIRDLIWLGQQIELAPIATDPATVIASVLQVAVAGFRLPVSIIDQNLKVLGQSASFAESVKSLGGAHPHNNRPLAGPWLTAEVEARVRTALKTREPFLNQPLGPSGNPLLQLDVFPFAFDDDQGFAVFSLHERAADSVFPWPTAVRAPASEMELVASQGDGRGPVSQFLEETLITGHRLLRRKDTSYLALRRWRSSIKPHQILALRALKADLPSGFVDRVAEEMAQAVRAVYGTVDACVVVPVPCGHSGPGCLSVQLAHAVAARLGIATQEAFAAIEGASGSSHPRKNAKRPSMQLVERVERPVILVDDVASSGSHIDEAATLLRAQGVSVWSVAWIAA